MKLLQTKYCQGKQGVEALAHKRNASYTWKSIAKQKEIITKGIKFNLRSGRRIRFWLDKWLCNNRLLDLALMDITESDQQKVVADYWEEYNWRWALLEDKLPHQVLLQLAAKRIIPQNPIPDCICWGLSPRGDFKVKSAYWCQFDDLTQFPNEETQISKIWK